MADITTPFPSTPIFQAVDFKVITPTITSETNSGKKRRVGQGVSYYTWTAKYAPMTPREAGPIIGFVRYCEGPLYSFEIILPQISYTTAYNQPANTFVVSSNLAVGTSNCKLTGVTINSEVLGAGDFFKFDNHSKVYQAVIACNSNGVGNATLTFASPLVSNVSAGTKLTITAVPFTAIVDSQEQDINVSYGGITSTEIKMREVW